MIFQKQSQFSKKPTDLPDKPSPSYLASQIKEYLEQPSNELLLTLNQLIDDLNSSGWVENSKLAPGSVAVTNLAPEILEQPTTTIETQMKLQDVDEQLADVAINVKSFGAILNGVTDDSSAIQQAIEHAKTNGYSKVKIPFTKSGFVVTSPIYIREGITLICDDAPTFRRNNFPYQKVIVGEAFTGEAVFNLESHASVDGFVLYDPYQKYELTSYTDSWVTGRPIGVQLGYSGYNAFDGNNVAYGNKINNIGFIGILRGIEQHSECINVESLHVSNLRGMPLEIGIHIRRAYDVLRFSNIHFNLNSYAGIYTGDASHYFRKVGTTAALFKFGRVDDPIISDCFSFGMKHFIHWYRDAFVGDSNNGGGAIIQGSSADACHVAFQVDRNGLGNFGVRVIGGFFVPVVKVSGSEQALIKFSGTATFGMFHLIGVRSFGDTVPSMGDATASDSTNYHIVWETTGINNIVMAVGCHFSQHVNGLTLGENPDANNRYSLMGSADNNILTNISNMHYILRSKGNDSPALKFEIDGTTFEFDAYGEAGSSMVRLMINGVTTWTFNQGSGNIQFGRNGAGISVKSPDGTKAGVYSVSNDNVPTFAGAVLARKVNVPASATATGQIGDWAIDSSYLYFVSAVNTWRRVAISAW